MWIGFPVGTRKIYRLKKSVSVVGNRNKVKEPKGREGMGWAGLNIKCYIISITKYLDKAKENFLAIIIFLELIFYQYKKYFVI